MAGGEKMKEGKDKRICELKEDNQKPSGRASEEDPSPGLEKMAPEEMKEYLDDLFRGYIFGKG
jgi:hypothetical protein